MYPSEVTTFAGSYGFKSRLYRDKPGGYQFNFSDIAGEYISTILEYRDEGLLDGGRQRIACIDFVFTGHRTNRQRGYIVSGAYVSSTPKISNLTKNIGRHHGPGRGVPGSPTA
jgi:hypothetical protein